MTSLTETVRKTLRSILDWLASSQDATVCDAIATAQGIINRSGILKPPKKSTWGSDGATVNEMMRLAREYGTDALNEQSREFVASFKPTWVPSPKQQAWINKIVSALRAVAKRQNA